MERPLQICQIANALVVEMFHRHLNMVTPVGMRHSNARQHSKVGVPSWSGRLYTELATDSEVYTYIHIKQRRLLRDSLEFFFFQIHYCAPRGTRLRYRAGTIAATQLGINLLFFLPE